VSRVIFFIFFVLGAKTATVTKFRGLFYNFFFLRAKIATLEKLEVKTAVKPFFNR